MAVLLAVSATLAIGALGAWRVLCRSGTADGKRAVAAAEAALPVELVEVRPGRSVAVHVRLRTALVPALGRSTRDRQPTLIFCHGSCASMLQWRAQIEHFGLTHSVVAFDVFGCGRSPKPHDWAAYSYANLRADLHALVARFGSSPGGVVLVAHSAACSTALSLAAGARPDATLKGLCLLGGFAKPPGTHPVFHLPVALLRLLQPVLSSGFEALALHPTTRAGTTEAHRGVLALAAEVNAANDMFMRATPPRMPSRGHCAPEPRPRLRARRCKAYYRQLGGPSVAEIRRARLPTTLLLCGASDRLITTEQSRALHALLGSAAELREVPSTAHQLMQEDPTAVNALLEGFVARL
jgi:pimeloyl-ACP methyl ester carboxylesterase